MTEQNNFKEDFINTYGEAKWKECQCVLHSNEGHDLTKESEKVAFRLLEILDWKCYEYGDSHGLDEKQVMSILHRNRHEILQMRIPPPSYIGLFAGRFGFLSKEELE